MADGTPSAGYVRTHGAQQLVAREWFGQIFVGADDASAGAIEQAILGTQHDHRRIAERRIVLDQRAGLIAVQPRHHDVRSEEHTSELQSLMRNSYAVFCLKHKTHIKARI